MRNSAVIAAAVMLVVLAAQPALAQDAFPSHLVTVINPNAPGGTADIISHGISESLQRNLKQTVVTINRPGAGGAVGGAQVAKATPDGYTVLLNTVTHVLIAITEQALGRPAPYTADDFVLIARVAADPLLFVVHPSLPVRNVRDFVALAKKRPGELTFSSTGMYGSGHISMAMLMRVAGIKLLHVPYNGAGPGIIALLGGDVVAFHAPVGVVSPHLSSGRLRLLAQTGAKRAAAFPDTPTLKESGYDSEFLLWSGYFAPAKTPPAVTKAWQNALRASTADPRFRTAMDKVNVTVDYLDGDALKTWYDAELKRLDREIRAIGKIETRM